MDGRVGSSSSGRRRRIHIPEDRESSVVGGLETLPSSILLNEILLRLDLETLCSLSCASKTMRFHVSQTLALFSSLNLSAFSPDGWTLASVARRCGRIKSVVLNCLKLDDESLAVLLGENIVELTLINCPLLSCNFLTIVGGRCPNLRVLVLEFASWNVPEDFRSHLIQMLNGCLYLESLCLKIRGAEAGLNVFESIESFMPPTIRNLKLDPVREQHCINLVPQLGVGRGVGQTFNLSTFVLPEPSCSTIQCLSLVLDVISDGLMFCIANLLPSLLELDLEDRPTKEPLLMHDLTNYGLQCLGSCLIHLSSLSLIRSRWNNPSVSFKRINDMGMFLLSEGCKTLESVRLCGFSKVSDAGFASVLHSCQKLQKFEVRNASMLSDLAFHDLSGAPCSLVEVKLLSCNLITSDAVEKLASSRSLELLDLCGCKSVADACLHSISRLCNLTTLNLSGADVTDGGLSAFGQCSPPIVCLSLKGCKRVTDRGVSHLLHGQGSIGKTLKELDLGYMPGISDKAIRAIAKAGVEITELCIRNCFYVSDFSIELLANKGKFQDGNKPLQRLNLHNCTGLSIESINWLKKPSFRGLRWLGVGNTRWTNKTDVSLSEICEERPWITLCFDGCEMGCYDGWQFHKPEQS